ncbi:MAG: RNA 3'-terminal phosphate cyclase [Methanosarcinales archaeon]|nr:RNA 3'-terminal phosphate cyclase [Methanosarcinales archaeon]
MIAIDGSFGEGGGQIIRTAVALSAVTGNDISINNIRENRPQPGLKAQHLTAVRTAAALTHADVTGMELGSKQVIFKPKGIFGGHYNVDIGTAGSITLLLQCLMPAAAMSPETVTLDIIGGTDVAWSPPIDYLSNVLLPVLTSIGLDCSIHLQKRGYYPRGGGRVRVVINPSKLTGIDIKKRPCNIMGTSHSSNLPEHVVQHQADSAVEALERAGYILSIDLETANNVSTGSGITLWSGNIGGSALGRRGLTAEKVGRVAAREIIAELDSGAAVDIYLADQLIPYMGLAGTGSFTSREISKHTSTNIWVVEQFLKIKFKIKTENNLHKVYL